MPPASLGELFAEPVLVAVIAEPGSDLRADGACCIRHAPSGAPLSICNNICVPPTRSRVGSEGSWDEYGSDARSVGKVVA